MRYIKQVDLRYFYYLSCLFKQFLHGICFSSFLLNFAEPLQLLKHSVLKIVLRGVKSRDDHRL